MPFKCQGSPLHMQIEFPPDLIWQRHSRCILGLDRLAPAKAARGQIFVTVILSYKTLLVLR